MNPFTYNVNNTGRKRRFSFRKRRFVKTVRRIARRSGEKKYLITDITNGVNPYYIGISPIVNYARSTFSLEQGITRSTRLGTKVLAVGVYVNVQLQLIFGTQNVTRSCTVRILMMKNKLGVSPSRIRVAANTTDVFAVRPFPDDALILADQYVSLGGNNSTQFYSYKRFFKIPNLTLQYDGDNQDCKNHEYAFVVCFQDPANNANGNQIKVTGYTSFHFYDS